MRGNAGAAENVISILIGRFFEKIQRRARLLRFDNEPRAARFSATRRRFREGERMRVARDIFFLFLLGFG